MNDSAVHAIPADHEHPQDHDPTDRDGLTTTLLQRARETSDEVEAARLRAQAVELNYALTCSIARRYAGRGLETVDLQQVALLALVLAVRRFVPEEGRTFSAFAVPTITGELKRHFRDRGWTIRPPRALRETYQEVQLASRDLEQISGRSPSVLEIAARLGVTVEKVRDAQLIDGCFRPTSLDAPLRDAPDSTVGDRADLATDTTEGLALSMTVQRMVRDLPARDRLMLRLRFEQDLTQREIGDRLGISQMQVSRLLTAVLQRLRSMLGAETQQAG